MVGHKSFAEMAVTLRAGYAAGMNCTITLEPHAAKHLADILDEHRLRRMSDFVDQIAATQREGE